MNIRIIREELRQVFEAMNEQMEIIQQHKDKIPQIEIDLFMANVRDLYEACITLNKLNAKSESLTKPPESEEKIREIEPIPVIDIPIRETFKFISQVEDEPETPLAQESSVSPAISEATEPEETEDLIPVDDITEFEPESEFEPELILESELVLEPESEPDFEPIVLITPKPEPVAPQPAHSPNLFSSSPTTIADKLKEEKLTMNEKLQSDSQHTSVGARLHQNLNQIRDLKSAIGINEKFQFINDLFKGSMQDYSLAMTQLNQFGTFEEALEYIDILKFKYTWDINSDAHHKLMDFVRRRYL